MPEASTNEATRQPEAGLAEYKNLQQQQTLIQASIVQRMPVRSYNHLSGFDLRQANANEEVLPKASTE